MDLIRTTDHIQSRPGFSDHNTAPRDLSKPIVNLSEFKGSAQPRGRAKAMDTLPPSLIARMTKGVLANQRRQLASQPSGSRDTRIAEYYKASYVLEDRGGVTAPGAELSLRPTGKAAGGMDNMSTRQLRELKRKHQNDMSSAISEYGRQLDLIRAAQTDSDAQQHLAEARRQQEIAAASLSQYEAANRELQNRGR